MDRSCILVLVMLLVFGGSSLGDTKGQCPPITYFHSIYDWVLENHVVNYSTVPKEDYCFAYCIKDWRCRSLNFEIQKKASESGHRCEINYSTMNRHPGYAKKRPGWIYYVMKDADSLPTLGGAASPGAYPYQAQLLINGQHNCGGSLIHPCYVLTAKHCVDGHHKSTIKVRLGEHDRLDSDSFVTQHSVVHIIKHPHIDVALVHITRSANLANSRIKTIPLASTPPAVGTPAIVTGWGWTKYLVPSIPNVLQVATIPIASVSSCNNELSRNLQAHEICAGQSNGDYKNACNGDSGGPLVVKTSSGEYQQVGIVSWGNGGCPANRNYAVYISVAAVRNWTMRYIPSSNPRAHSDCNCVHPARQPNGTAVPAFFDGANCFLGRARSGCSGEAKSYIYDNRFYITSSTATFCPMGWFDSCNCYIMPKPNRGFIYHNKFYQRVPPGGCPPGTSFDGASCFIKAAPWATTAFEYNGTFYTTARKQCGEPNQFRFDGASCYFRTVPAPNPFIYKNAYYTDKLGGSCPSGSRWDGANCYYRHAPWATKAFLFKNAFYSTTRRQCYQGSFDGANCLIMAPPLGATAFLHNGNYYYGW